jgi:hypothetical protein
MKLAGRIYVLLGLTLFTNCSQQIAPGTPSCIEGKIKDFKKSGICDTGKEVAKYLYQNKNVYSFSKGVCGADLASEVLDAYCNSLGFLGGLSGNTEINGDDFSSAQFVAIVWED